LSVRLRLGAPDRIGGDLKTSSDRSSLPRPWGAPADMVSESLDSDGPPGSCERRRGDCDGYLRDMADVLL